MSRTRRRHPAPDDPRLPRKFRQDSGVNLMHMDDWYGFNVAGKIPPRDDVDPAGNPFLGLPANRIKYRDLSNNELAADSVDGRTIKALEVNTGHLNNFAVNNDKLAGTSVSTGKLQDQAATAEKIAKNPHGIDPLSTTNQADDFQRAISGDHVKTKTLEGFHFKDNSIGSRAIVIGLADVAGKLGAHRISGKIPKHNISGVNWEDVDNKPPLATKHFVDDQIADLKRWANNRFQRKP